MYKEPIKFFVSILPDRLYLQLFNYYKFGKFINFNNPKSFNENINYIKLFERSDLLTICSDKYLVREYVEEVIGEHILIPLLWKGTEPKEIPFNKLPNSYVIKCNHASGTNVVVKNKNKVNKNEVVNKLLKWMNYDYFLGRREWGYKNIERKIIIEKFIGENNEVPTDYKFYVINGKIELIHVDINRFNNHQKYDLDSNLNSFHFADHKVMLPKPKNFELMKSHAEKLAKKFRFVRVDFYNIKGKIYFGEMTFYPSGGFKEFEPAQLDEYLGLKFGDF